MPIGRSAGVNSSVVVPQEPYFIVIETVQQLHHIMIVWSRRDFDTPG